MNSAASRALLARLRASTRLAVLVLLLFVMKIGAAAACIQHDFADLGMGAKASLEAVAKVPADDGAGALKKGSSGACSHCSCHHAAVMAPETSISVPLPPQGVAVLLAGVPPSVPSRLELRPPIA
ncbi:hypothetical protein JY409_04870 [Stenotrophomonas maltophilia]|jgi:hypothetical protein|nr:hypothetical protein [Stenotrophomonas maltophilia]